MGVIIMSTTIEKANNVLNDKFIEKIQPILNLDFWKRLNFFADKDIGVAEFTVIKALAIMKNADCWQKQDEFDNYDDNYNLEISLLNFANNFIMNEPDYLFERLTKLFTQFNDNVLEDEITNELHIFLNDCNLPHAVLAIEEYDSEVFGYGINPYDLPFTDILCDFSCSKEDYDYVDDEYSDKLGYDRRFADVYVKQRQKSIDNFFMDYIDEYYSEIENDEDEEE